MRGQWYDIGDGRWWMPVFHPSYLLRNPQWKPGAPKVPNTHCFVEAADHCYVQWLALKDFVHVEQSDGSRKEVFDDGCEVCTEKELAGLYMPQYECKHFCI